MEMDPYVSSNCIKTMVTGNAGDIKWLLRKYKIFSNIEDHFFERIKKIFVVGIYFGIIITRDDEVFTLGPVHVHRRNYIPNLVPKKIEELSGESVKYFAFSRRIVALTEDGKVYSWAPNAQRNCPSRFSICLGGYYSLVCKNIVEVACGSYHSLALSCDGEVYEWGELVGCPLGFRKINCFHERKSGCTRSQCQPYKVVHIACSSRSSVVLTEMGEVYTWGRSLTSCCNFSVPCSELQPIKVRGLESKFITQIACGVSHSLALSVDGSVFAWGANNYGQLGIGNRNTLVDAKQVSRRRLGKVVQVAALYHFNISVAVNENDVVYIWGHVKGLGPILTPRRTSFKQLNNVFASFAIFPVTYNPIELNSTRVSHPRIDDSLMFDDESTSDLMIKVEEQPIFVHKSVLISRSDYFKCMFEKDWQESKKQEIEIKHFNYETYRLFLYFLYTGEMNVKMEGMVRLVNVAHYHIQTNLLSKCEKALMREVTVKNVCYLYNEAMMYGLKKLENLCIGIILRFFNKIYKRVNWERFDDNTKKKLTDLAAKYNKL